MRTSNPQSTIMIGVFARALLALLYSGTEWCNASQENPTESSPKLPDEAVKQGFVMGGNIPLMMLLIPDARELIQQITRSSRINQSRPKSKSNEWNKCEEARHAGDQRPGMRGGVLMDGGMGGGGMGCGGMMGGGIRGGGFRGVGIPAKGVDYIGRGYNLVFGNPDIIALGTAKDHVITIATDPGMRDNYILKLTWMYTPKDSFVKGRVPDQVNYFNEQSCFNAMTNKLITGANSQQKKLFDGFDHNSGFNINALAERSFMGSQINNNMGADIRHKERIYVESRHVCTFASARYRLAADRNELFLDEDFKRAVCSMPDEYNDDTKDYYTQLVDEFGTSVVVGATLGAMDITRIELATDSLLKNALEGNIDNSIVGTNILGRQSVMNFNFQNATIDVSSDSEMVRHTIRWTLGSMDNPKPTKLSIINLDDVMADDFWYVHCQNSNPWVQDCCRKIPEYRKNIHKALIDYGTNKDIPAPTKQDDIVKAPLNWPRGYYGLPATIYGCPEETENMKWQPGIRMQKTHRDNDWSSGIHWPNLSLNTHRISQQFCIKDTDKTTNFDLEWPAGTYCILRKHKCPAGFKDGWIGWPDPGSSNDHAYLGMLPDGVYDQNTRIEYCCRNDEPTVKEIDLPMQRPFYLMMYGNECQRVKGMTVTEEWVFWDGADTCAVFCSRDSQGGGHHPRNDYEYENNKLYYCYYEKKLELDTAMSMIYQASFSQSVRG